MYLLILQTNLFSDLILNSTKLKIVLMNDRWDSNPHEHYCPTDSISLLGISSIGCTAFMSYYVLAWLPNKAYELLIRHII